MGEVSRVNGLEETMLTKWHFLYLSESSFSDKVQRIEVFSPKTKFLYFRGNWFDWKEIETGLSDSSVKTSAPTGI